VPLLCAEFKGHTLYPFLLSTSDDGVISSVCSEHHIKVRDDTVTFSYLICLSVHTRTFIMKSSYSGPSVRVEIFFHSLTEPLIFS
jgi:hypothetical protein